MSEREADIKADIRTDMGVPHDQGESTAAMEPILIGESSKHRSRLADLALELTEKSTGLSRSLPPQMADALANVVRSMNCYYSNLIEGHDTHPVDIDRALNSDFSLDPRKRDLQLEAKAHIEVQRWIDEGGLPGPAVCQGSILLLHREFCRRLPETLLWVENPDTQERLKVIPGALRQHHVAVGRHIAVSPGALPRFMQRFEEGYVGLGKVDRILSAATAHHRLLWMHPFLDGNGRVARLMSHAILREAMNTGGIWSIARGLARNESAYKTLLAACDEARHGDYDGRGSLSEERLAEFTVFFLETCIDQIDFMESLIQPDRLRHRILIWAEEEIRLGILPPRANEVIDAALYRGALARADIQKVLGTGERQARRITSALLGAGVFTADSTRAPLHLAFPAKLAARWLPGLFPDF